MSGGSAADNLSKEQLNALLAPHNQQHLLQFWDELTHEDRRQLAETVATIDFALVSRLFHAGASSDDWSQLADRAEPPVAVRLDGRGNRHSTDEARSAGERALRSGEVGAILVAGGEGSRLGFNQPKGMFPIGPVSGATLFQVLLEKLVAVGRRYGVATPLCVMTSHATHQATADFLQENNCFGLPAGDVRLFRQGVMPAVDASTGKMLLADKGTVALSPDGHGGMLDALVRTGALADISKRRLKYLFYFQVDNPLASVCDPMVIGHHILAGSEMTTLAVAKLDPLERVGNIVQIDGRTRIIEYIHLPAEVARRRNPDGTLRLWAGSTAIHVFNTSFLERAAADKSSLPFHVARKKVAHLDERGNRVEPAEPNALKFERFIFDLLPMAERALVVEADRAATFAPVKNAVGQRDSLTTSQAAMIALYRRWLEAAGAKVAPGVPVEISPLAALDEVELRDKIKPGTHIDKPTYLRQ